MNNANPVKEIVKETRDIWDKPGTRSAVRKNFEAILDCGTAKLGWLEYASENERRRCYYRCKSRFCPSCGYRATLQWFEDQAVVLPDLAYVGIVLTMPSTLWSVFRADRNVLHDLAALGAAVITQWMKMKYGITPMILVIPHTFGGDLKFNTHLHMLVSASGLDQASGRWISGECLNKTAIMRMWRYAVVNHLRLANRARVLKTALSNLDLNALLFEAYRTRDRDYWIIHIDSIFSNAHFLKYIARYVRRPPIANKRILMVGQGKVEFLTKNSKRKPPRRVICTTSEFIRLLAAHVPDKGRHGIRYFGVLAPRSRNRIVPTIFLMLDQKQRPKPKRLTWRECRRKHFGVDPMIDNFGQEMHWV